MDASGIGIRDVEIVRRLPIGANGGWRSLNKTVTLRCEKAKPGSTTSAGQFVARNGRSFGHLSHGGLELPKTAAAGPMLQLRNVFDRLHNLFQFSESVFPRPRPPRRIEARTD